MASIERLPLSFQMYSARKFPPIDEQLPHLKEAGYDAVEPWPGAYQVDPAALRRALDAAGLGCFGMHVPLEGLEKDPDRYSDCALILGASRLIVPAVPSNSGADQPGFWIGIGQALRAAGETLADRGFQVLWHNHDGEYARLPDGSLPIDRLFEGAGDSIGFEIDCGWVVRAGADIRTELDRHSDRISAIHIKDIAPDGTAEEDGWTAIGDGLIEWPSLADAIRDTHVDHLVVEHDNPSDWKAFAVRSAAYLRRIQL